MFKRNLSTVVALAMIFPYCPAAYPANEATGIKVSKMPISVSMDCNHFARSYEGLGCIESYGKLLFNYPDPERSQILDFLFKPNYGASLQILKVELGSDTNNTTMAIAAHQREADEEPNFKRGYMWWLMHEAKKRNPDILLAALHWGYPGWCVTDDLKAQFIYDFVAGAKSVQGITIDVIGGNQNESYPLNAEVTKLLRRKLDSGGLSNVKIVAADEDYPGWRCLELLVADREYYDAVGIVGTHFKKKLRTPPQAIDIGKTLWSSEDTGGSYDNPVSGYHWPKQVIRLFSENHFSAIIRWLLTASAYPNMSWPTGGIMKTNEPWSGHYKIGANLWGYAHFTQFVRPGWKIIDAPETSFFKDSNGKGVGRYVAFTDPNTGDFTIVIETTGDEVPDKGLLATFTLDGKVADKPVHIWRSNFYGEEAEEWFIKTETLQLHHQSFSVNLDKTCVYTISTTTGQQKGEGLSPAPKPFSLPYSDDFEGYTVGDMPKFFVDAHGAFEIAEASGGRSGKVMKQVIKTPTIPWHPHTGKVDQPITEMGDITWKDYTVSVDVLLQTEGRALVCGRFDGRQTYNSSYLLEGYWLSIDHQGHWKLFRLATPKYPREVNKTFYLQYIAKPDLIVTLAEGKMNGFGLNKWINVSLAFQGSKIKASLDGKTVAGITDSVYPNGNIACSTIAQDAANFFSRTESPYCIAEFDNFKVR